MYIWDWFWEISSTRKDEATPISYQDVLAWRSLTGNLISPQECAIILDMDGVFRSALSEEIRANTARAEARRGKPKGVQ